MDATGSDRPTALVHGSASALLGQVAVSLAERGYDVHLTPGVLPATDVPGWTWRRLHVAADGEQALLAAVAGQARPLEVAVLDVADQTSAELLRTVATYQRASGRGRLLRVARTGRTRRATRVTACGSSVRSTTCCSTCTALAQAPDGVAHPGCRSRSRPGAPPGC